MNPPSGTLRTLDSGEILLAGGETTYGTGYLACLYNSASNAFLLTGSLNHPRVVHTATLLDNGQVLVAGGQVKNASGGGFSILSSAELYTP